MDDVRALFFDVGGTVSDWKTTAIETAGALGGPSDVILDALDSSSSETTSRG